ncbi:hypothetical protein DPMN_192392 [Dreissena polymorpha]|uniref:Uncharacterized protein n=1 Tax=Dreissena polymorpha TaxID=45954 RepID=A0A9D4BCE1_DREPO|nr:hypothetical protein DPMN_192392 [Dreissena polymorpha]
MARLSRLCTSSSISFPNKYRLFILLNGCENWTLHMDTERRIQAFAHNILALSLQGSQDQRILPKHNCNTCSPQEPLLAIVNERKLA